MLGTNTVTFLSRLVPFGQLVSEKKLTDDYDDMITIAVNGSYITIEITTLCK
jgi:hypothetical protein